MCSSLGRAALILLGATLSACTAAVPKSFQYSPDMADALVVLGVAPPSTDVSIRVSAVDPQTCRLSQFAGMGDKSFGFTELWGQPKHTKYVVGEYEPGTYVISSMTGGRAGGAVLNLGTIAFKVEAGDFIYIGDFRLVGDQPQFLGYHPDGVARELAKYPGLPKDPTHHKPILTTFAGQKEGGRVPGCKL